MRSIISLLLTFITLFQLKSYTLTGYSDFLESVKSCKDPEGVTVAPEGGSVSV